MITQQSNGGPREPPCLSVVQIVMEAGAVALQRKELVAVAFSPAQNILHRVHAVFVDIVLKHNGNPMLLDTRNPTRATHFSLLF